MKTRTRKLIIAKLILLFGWLCCAPEVVSQSRTYLGSRIGYNLARSSFKDPFRGLPMRIRNRMSMQGGFILRHYFKQTYPTYRVALQMECIYSQKGYRQVFREEDPTFVVNMNYIELPLMAHMSYTKGAYIPFMYAGAFYERLLHISQNTPTLVPENYEIHPFRKDIDRREGLGLRFGVGLEMELIGGRVTLEIIQSQSLQSFLRDNRLVNDTPVRSRLQLTSFSLSYLYPLYLLRRTKVSPPSQSIDKG